MGTMKITAEALCNEIELGMFEVYQKYCLMTGQECEPVEPEYLTSAGLTFRLAEYFDRIGPDSFSVRAEEQTRVVWRRAMLPVIVRGRNLLARNRVKEALKKNSSRKGNVDISIAGRSSEWESTFAVIENKGLLRFAGNGRLYKSRLNEISKDLKRNAEFVQGLLSTGVECAVFTFYLHDVISVLKADGVMYIAEKQQYFEKLASDYDTSGICRIVKVATLDDRLFANREEAEEPDEHGMPAYEKDGTSHLAMGLICFWRPGTHIGGKCDNWASEATDG